MGDKMEYTGNCLHEIKEGDFFGICVNVVETDGGSGIKIDSFLNTALNKYPLSSVRKALTDGLKIKKRTV